MSLSVYHSNRLEALSGVLAGLINDDPPDPFTPERIVIPHRTMAQWLRLEIARDLGIAANIDFEQPAAFAWSILRGAVPSLPKTQGFAPDALRWHLFELLPEFAKGGDAAEVRRYLADGDEVKRFELADKLAGVYDRCLNFRPDWIRDWEQGATPHWQARLWRMLTQKISETHWVNALDAFSEQSAPRVQPEDWPERAFIFGVSSFSPSYMQLLEKLGETIELHMLMLNPSEEYWRDIQNQREIQAAKSRLGADEVETEDLHFEVGNELLAAWGRLCRDTFGELAEVSKSTELFPNISENSRLAAVQVDIQSLRSAANPANAEDNAEATPSPPPDASMQIHCCHSPMREAEVLHDRLLDLLETHTEIEPADIMILTPDLPRYGPAVAAVFEAEGRIPVALSRSQAVDSPTMRAFFDLLQLPGTRLGVEAMLAPLDAPSLRAKFEFEESDLPEIREWIKQAGIRRNSVDEGDATPIFPGNTWRDGFNRLLVGYAAGEMDDLVLGIASSSIRKQGGFEAGGENYATMGRIISYCDAVFAMCGQLARPGNSEHWGKLLREIFSKFFDDGSLKNAYDDFDEIREISGEFGEVAALLDSFADQAGRIDCEFSFEVVRKALLEAASGPSIGPTRLTDGAAVGKLASGQIPPAKIVCVMGMNGGGFPRNSARHTFDIVERDKRRAGDRDPRHEDRFAFLEALLAARKAFIITYSGRDQRDDSHIPPSIVVDELHDYLVKRFPKSVLKERADEGEAAVGDDFRFDHPLQAFSAHYFSDENLFSYSQSMFEAAKMLRQHKQGHKSKRVDELELEGAKEEKQSPVQGGRETPQNRFGKPIGQPGASRRKISLRELEEFFASPARGFLRERFEIRPFRNDEANDEVEPLQLNKLEQFQLRQEILDRTDESRERKVSPENVRSRLLASGKLPHGGFGDLVYDDALGDVEDLREALRKHSETLAVEPQHIDIEISDFRLVGTIPHIGPETMLWWRNGKLRGQDKARIRLRQLAWMAAGNPPLPMTAVHMNEKDKFVESVFPAPFPEEESLHHWLEAWWSGLSQPLRFFPESSAAYAEELGKESGTEQAASLKAQKIWHDEYRGGGTTERGKPENSLAWDLGDIEHPLNEEFQELAKKLLSPMHEKKPI